MTSENILSSGERAAITRGDELITNEQAAVCYLQAKDLTHKIFGSRNGSVKSDKASTQKSYEISDMMGLNNVTFLRTVKKFKIILGEEEQNGEAMCPKYDELVRSFEDSKVDDVITLAKTAFTDEAKIKGQEFKDQRAEKVVKTKKKGTFTSQQATDYYKGWYAHYVAGNRITMEEAKKKAVKQTSVQMNMPVATIEKMVSL